MSHFTGVCMLVVCMLNACTTITRAELDPCGDQNRRTSRQTGSISISCFRLNIPFRVTVLDATTNMPISAAAVLRGQNVIDEPILDGPALGWTAADGTLSVSVDTFIHTENPFTECFRQSFPGILVEVHHDGYESHRLRVPLPLARGHQVDLGAISLTRTEEGTE